MVIPELKLQNIPKIVSTFENYRKEIAEFNEKRPDMIAVGNYNHEMIDIFNQIASIQNKHLLDIGASPHGYALERALQCGVASYTGIGLAPQEITEVHHDDRIGQLINMNAESLAFDSESFDLIISLSTFEHFHNGNLVLEEMYRVLKPGGSVLINFQPIWTSSYGHHLHHLPSINKLVPPWAHLLLKEDEMRHLLSDQWPVESPMSLDEVIEWIYHGDEINRVDVIALRNLFYACRFEIEWITPLSDDDSNNKRIIADYLSKILPYSAEDLMTRGYSLLMKKK